MVALSRPGPRPWGVLLSLALGLSCAPVDTSDGDVPDFQVSWLTPSGEIPADVGVLRVLRVYRDGTQDDQISRSRRAIVEDGDRALIVPRLPYHEEIDLELQAHAADCGDTDPYCNLRYVGRTGPMVLRPGERRYVPIAMYPVAASATLNRGAALPPRFLHTSTALDDGRVLIAGGFTSLESADCPDGLDATRCFAARADDRAYVLDPATARFHEVQDTLQQARGGHTATRLADGTVVIAGGAPRAIVAFRDVGGEGEPVRAREVLVLPFLDADTPGAHATSELFDPDANPEAEDLERDGDPGRGGFLGDPNETGLAPIPLNEGRFLHAAAADPSSGDRVVLFGGTVAPTTYEVFDLRKPGGPGVYDNGGASLGVARVAPRAVAMGAGATARIWVFGGVQQALSNDDLADVWTPEAASPNGTLRPGTEDSFFPTSTGTDEDFPELALIRPGVAAVGDSHILINGWYGPRCPAGATATTAPVFGGPEICGHQGGPDRIFTVQSANGSTMRGASPISARHALSEAVRMRDGRVLLVGGVQNGTFANNVGTAVYDGVEAGRARGAGGPLLSQGRFFHAGSALTDSGVVITGGITLDATGVRASLVAPSEVVMLAPPNRPTRMTRPEDGE
ncbi:MAG: hypothetical protein KF901_32040 [Myxococcales bacterium]|nr:hypothetical protein [Myxococcales bacterium]